MKRTVTYTLTEEQASCVGEIRTAKRDLETMGDRVLKVGHFSKIKEEVTPQQFAEFCYSVADTLSYALNKLELED